ncbi:DNA polymerase I [Candidatus Dependentiae bacterium]
MHRIKKDALFLIDGSYLLYRSYYGLRPLQTSSGMKTQAVYGFCRAIKKMIKEFDPKNIALVWDSKGKTFRSEIYHDYKATRQVPPSDLFVQKDAIIKFVDSIGIKQVSKVGYEADDLIGSIVNDCKELQIIIVGPDKDLYQLLADDTVLIYDPFKDKMVDAKDFKKEKGFGPKKVAFFYSLVGDASDNIPGVKGIGKKTAQNIVQDFDSLDDLYKNIEKVKKERLSKLLKEGKENAFLSFKLFSLRDYKLDLKIEDFKFDTNNWARAENFFSEYEFTSLLSDLRKRFKIKNISSSVLSKEEQLSLFLVNKKQNTIDQDDLNKSNWNYFVVHTLEDLDQIISLAKTKKLFALDTETDGFRPFSANLVGISFAFDKKKAYYIPLSHKDYEAEGQLEIDSVLKKIKPVLQNSAIKKILQNTKFDQLMLLKYDIEIKGVVFDTLLAANLLKKEDNQKINLKALSMRYLKEPMKTFKEVLGKCKDFSEVPISKASLYAAYDSLQTFKLKPILEKELDKDDKLKKLFEKVEMPISQVLLKMESHGIFLDKDRLREVGKQIGKDLNTIKKKIFASIEHRESFKSINLNSSRQVEKLLFYELELPVLKKTAKGKPSTDQEVLEELSKINPIPGMIKKYREYAKLASTYIEPLIKKIDLKTERIHTNFSQIIVATGRISSSDPNLQNIPVSSDYGIKIRSAFVAPKGRLFLSADYSQIDLRVLAHLSGDENLQRAFKQNKDIHTQTASQILNIPLEKVSSKERKLGKTVNFGIMYGLTPFGLSKDLGIKPSEAKDYIEKYLLRYNGVEEWIKKTVSQAEKTGYVRTWLGRKRYLSGLQEKNRILYQAARRMAINTPVQGTSAEILKLAMLKLYTKLNKLNGDSFMVLQIHDEIIVEFSVGQEEDIKKIVIKCMEKVVKWAVPLVVSVKIGKSWEDISK